MKRSIEVLRRDLTEEERRERVDSYGRRHTLWRLAWFSGGSCEGLKIPRGARAVCGVRHPVYVAVHLVPHEINAGLCGPCMERPDREALVLRAIEGDGQ